MSKGVSSDGFTRGNHVRVRRLLTYRKDPLGVLTKALLYLAILDWVAQVFGDNNTGILFTTVPEAGRPA